MQEHLYKDLHQTLIWTATAFGGQTSWSLPWPDRPALTELSNEVQTFVIEMMVALSNGNELRHTPKIIWTDSVLQQTLRSRAEPPTQFRGSNLVGHTLLHIQIPGQANSDPQTHTVILSGHCRRPRHWRLPHKRVA